MAPREPSARWTWLAVPLAICLSSVSCANREPSTLQPRALIERAWTQAEPAAPPRALSAVAFAAAQVGKPYCWGGSGPRCFDCSGLAQSAWRAVGIQLPRTADAIKDALPEVGVDEIRAGDILWWPGHVGVYAGNGWVVEALDARHGVVIRPAWSPQRAFRPAEATHAIQIRADKMSNVGSASGTHVAQ